jgi:hypothetical protein
MKEKQIVSNNKKYDVALISFKDNHRAFVLIETKLNLDYSIEYDIIRIDNYGKYIYVISLGTKRITVEDYHDYLLKEIEGKQLMLRYTNNPDIVSLL